MTLLSSAQPTWTARYAEATVQRLGLHLSLLRKWNSAINLVAPATLGDVWSRHVLDSAQLFDLRCKRCRSWADLGSGAGFPGLTVAILAADGDPHLHVTLVEADQRKAEFLRTVSRETGVTVTVLAARIEDVPPLNADVVSARALAPLDLLCGYAWRHMSPSGRALFLKGARAEEEVEVSRKAWHFTLETVESVTDPSANVLRLTELRRV